MTTTPAQPSTGADLSRKGLDGLLVVDKPAGWTSHDVVARVRRLAGSKKVGHAGTLDPMATGVLVIGLGRATRLLGHLALRDKTYTATIRLGKSTVTDDADGEVLATADASSLASASIETAVRALTGHQLQVPAAVSAVKVAGQRSYARVRAGETVSLSPRSVLVTEFVLRSLRRVGPFVDIDVAVECSTGTYVRALARDLGRQLSVGGHLTELRRTRVGAYTLADTVTLPELAEFTIPNELPVMSLDAVAARSFATYQIADESIPAVRNGRRISADLPPADGPVAVVTTGGEFLALYQADGAVARAVAVFAPG
jgi:tRNA pseudouridine55 synthase